eukprot:COSAG06_NODE_4828_length_3926_cov_3.148680_2_plen_147_part_00
MKKTQTRDSSGPNVGGGGGGGGGGGDGGYGKVVDGVFKIGKPPPGMDMFGEMDWKKKAKKAKAEWEAKNGGPPAAGGGGGGGKGGGGGGGGGAAAPSGPEQYGGPVDGKWKNAKVPESVAGDMFAEMAWKKKQKAAKAEWQAANPG